MAIPDPNAEIRDPSPPAPKGPTKINKLISKIKKKLAAIKKMNDDPDNQVKDFDGDGPFLKKGKEKFNKYKEKKVKEAKDKLDELKSKNAKKNKGKKNIFGEILELVTVFLPKNKTITKPYGYFILTQKTKFSHTFIPRFDVLNELLAFFINH